MFLVPALGVSNIRLLHPSSFQPAIPQSLWFPVRFSTHPCVPAAALHVVSLYWQGGLRAFFRGAGIMPLLPSIAGAIALSGNDALKHAYLR